MKRLLAYGALAVWLSACAVPGLRPEQDRAPRIVLPGALSQETLQPRWEPRAAVGNHSPYRVFGVEYRVLPSAEQFEERGIASWYGRKFHGRPTSSGEPYDMFALTAAHKHLPLPTYVRVTREDTGASLVVRVNDRGPFHDDRIIDLSYAAARRLGFHEQGTAPVRLEALAFPPPASELPQAPARATAGKALWLQAGAFQDRAAAAALAAELSPLLTLAASPAPLSIRQDPPPFHRVRIGPFEDVRAAERVQALLMFSDVPATPLLIEE